MVYTATDADKALRSREAYDQQREYDTDKLRLFCEDVRKRFDNLLASERASREERLRSKVAAVCEELERE